MTQICILFLIFPLVVISAAGAGEIHDAVTQAQIERVHGLLETNPQLVLAPGPNDLAPLHLACLYRHEAIAELLIARGADVRAHSGVGDTPLHLCASYKQGRIVELLLRRGADVMAKNSHESTPLHYATTAASRQSSALFSPRAAIRRRAISTAAHRCTRRRERA